MKQQRAIVTPNAPEPVGPYSQAIVLDSIVYCSGQLGIDPATGELVTGSVADQTRQCMKNLAAVLAAAETDFSHVVRATIYITSMGDFPAVNAAYGEFLSEPFPARATIEVGALAKGAAVEIDVIAQIP
jgi:2-iminobutanoate/2-iminopropanoate deaminase